MADHPHPIDELQQRVDALSAEIARLRAALGDEIRCRRLVVSAPDGTERIIVEATDSWASVRVVAPRPDGCSTDVELFAADPADADPAGAGLALGRDGDVVALIDHGADGRARWWRAGDDEAADWQS